MMNVLGHNYSVIGSGDITVNNFCENPCSDYMSAPYVLLGESDSPIVFDAHVKSDIVNKFRNDITEQLPRKANVSVNMRMNDLKCC